ncbi:hypothetical protein [Aliarcobacter skirrowii]|uniref:Antitoxin n=1 Tax=Aliarcobacter skirrowii CCUG 10374 TaxID=1032239 RepID=A0AAD0SMD8_9BACT|nr:hypothetical protein [Aliarcobacter skirrowii]AXX85205.1 hypothetical protein ASKIR_1404 [Aliarcobacter skirrowii CCUG 10374]KAB0620639.1 hypothetical protein F7P70_05745 [Aliarcobacter skirrowii CCUG 10374]RXI26013.1 hypothetical protein CP959_06860 [Aliarcobacter skirrowii CCUG 10374]SUU96265.1 Uncharacterised protein [Aliarcobacter skirrowii]
MHTIKLNISDSLYTKLANKKIDIESAFEELLYDLVDDGYSSISKEDADKRVSDAVLKYKKGELKTVAYEDGMDKIDNWLKSIK